MTWNYLPLWHLRTYCQPLWGPWGVLLFTSEFKGRVTQPIEGEDETPAVCWGLIPNVLIPGQKLVWVRNWFPRSFGSQTFTPPSSAEVSKRKSENKLHFTHLTAHRSTWQNFSATNFGKSALFRIKLTCESDPSMLFFLPGLAVMKNHCFGINAHTFICQVGHPSCMITAVDGKTRDILTMQFTHN